MLDVDVYLNLLKVYRDVLDVFLDALNVYLDARYLDMFDVFLYILDVHLYEYVNVLHVRCTCINYLAVRNLKFISTFVRCVSRCVCSLFVLLNREV